MRYLVPLLLLVFVGCDSSTDTASEGPVLQGYVKLKDTLGRDLADHSGASVSILGATKVTTDADGQWNLTGFPFNSPFTLVFTKPGFAEERIAYTAKPTEGGNVQYGEKRMYAIQYFSPILVLRAFEDIYGGSKPVPSYRAVLSIRIPEFDDPNFQGAQGYCSIYFGKTSTTSASMPTSYQYNTSLRQTSSSDGVSYFDVYADSLIAHGFTKGEKVYCVGYPAGYYSASSYYIDAATSKVIYTGFSPINTGVKNFIVP